MKLGILDQVVLPEGKTHAQVLTHTEEMIRQAETLGYERYWFAEHHSTNGMMSAAPELWIARWAAAAPSMMFGSGGILLPQYSPLKVAEQFSTLETMFPGRVELGVGRSPGGTERTREALAGGASAMDDFLRQVGELKGFLQDTLPKNHRHRIVKTTPRHAPAPPLWILGLSPGSAETAAAAGAGLVFGHFISPDKWEETLRSYREQAGEKARVRTCVFVVCAETEETAEALLKTQDAWMQQYRRGSTIIPSPETARRMLDDPETKRAAENERRRTVYGTPSQVLDQLEELARRYESDDFLLITNIHDLDARLTSYRLLMAEKEKRAAVSVG
ncbi:MsnO8 family LLM class oxidoreductase [Alkalicoccus urumqiensis]|uniref:LLM class flavin-dependent oxidoreductase n=1 Tax=Alkalicoccus urumqiensis TaxID=1548213 RepID=A0A2P6MDK3_ALKUR|nr:MsnO8 family LLM class oxidoreductase [Alkalicoccus urumqiensis]PRO64356.1 LLM class flavin-dependent oxidoreductase [Alkalicoccus urumqiensis]